MYGHAVQKYERKHNNCSNRTVWKKGMEILQTPAPHWEAEKYPCKEKGKAIKNQNKQKTNH